MITTAQKGFESGGVVGRAVWRVFRARRPIVAALSFADLRRNRVFDFQHVAGFFVEFSAQTTFPSRTSALKRNADAPAELFYPAVQNVIDAQFATGLQRVESVFLRETQNRAVGRPVKRLTWLRREIRASAKPKLK